MTHVEEVFRAEYGRMVAGLVRRFGDIDIAEEALADALVIALQRWPRDGVPPNPAAWLTRVAGNKAIDRLRREKVRDEKYAEAAMLQNDTPAEPTGPVTDDRLRLIFTCCHPALAPENRIALTLRLLGGLTVAEIAHAFLVPETTMAQRITRAKTKIKQARIPYRVPIGDDLPNRMVGVLAVLYLIFNEGYLSTTAPSVREDLCTEAIRLTRQLREASASLGPPMDQTQPEVLGLLALMLLLDARRPARVRDGVLVTFPDQDRSAWNSEQIEEGHALVRQCLALNRPGPYQIQAAINAVHTDAPDASSVDWSQVVALYDQLAALTPSPIVALNRAIAVAELDGPQVALAIVDDLDLGSYHAFHATRADLLRRLGRYDEAREAYGQAIALTENEAERAWRASWTSQPSPSGAGADDGQVAQNRDRPHRRHVEDQPTAHRAPGKAVTAAPWGACQTVPPRERDRLGDILGGGAQDDGLGPDVIEAGVKRGGQLLVGGRAGQDHLTGDPALQCLPTGQRPGHGNSLLPAAITTPP